MLALSALAALSISCVPVFSGGDGGVDFQKKKNLSYVPAAWPKNLKGDLYLPETGAGKAPVVLLIHGDARMGTDGRWHLAGIAQKLARRGYAVFNITYRMAPEWEYPAPLDDARMATAWLHDHADEYGIDPERIGVWGYSAGGYVGLLTSMTAEPGEFQAAVAGASPTNLMYYSGGQLIQNFLGGRFEDIPEKYWEASPVNYVTADSPPVFFYHGEDDLLVNPDHLWEMSGKLDESGVPNEVYWIRKKGHVRAFFDPDGAIDQAIDFLDLYLK